MKCFDISCKGEIKDRVCEKCGLKQGKEKIVIKVLEDFCGEKGRQQ